MQPGCFAKCACFQWRKIEFFHAIVGLILLLISVWRPHKALLWCCSFILGPAWQKLGKKLKKWHLCILAPRVPGSSPGWVKKLFKVENLRFTSLSHCLMSELSFYCKTGFFSLSCVRKGKEKGGFSACKGSLGQKKVLSFFKNPECAALSALCRPQASQR